MNFSELKQIIKHLSQKDNFQNASNQLIEIIFNLKKNDFIPLIIDIGSIPEDIPHDSTEEKFYTKVSDIILAKCFIELGLKATVLTERANCADVIGESIYHKYSLVADAKAFRLSRTAKNQKDFKVESMVHWRKDNDYSVLCSPYFQYPQTKSQIYASALQGNVSLFSWEYFYILLNENIKETSFINLSNLWNYSSFIAQNISVSNSCKSFLVEQDSFIAKFTNISDKEFSQYFKYFKRNTITRCKTEITYWENTKKHLENLSKEEAINELIKAMKLNEKINSINYYINKLKDYNGVR